jgi:hypothetical protein
MNEELKQMLTKPAVPLLDAGRIAFGLGKTSTYRAARGGSIPTIRIGGQYFVATAVLRQMLGLESVAA